jgi:AcrR family transcriptional regulator
MSTRRAALRKATTRDIKAAALDHLRTHGPVGLSLRAVARDAGISAPGLYRYFESRDALLTALIADGYDELADHLLLATGCADERSATCEPTETDLPLCVDATASPAERLRAAALAYRHWAVSHPNEFSLVFGDPIPGYAAPVGGATVVAMTRVGDALARPLVEAWQEGALQPHPAFSSPELIARLAAMSPVAGTEIPGELGGVLLTAWGRLHGTVSLEVFGHHRWLFPDGAACLYEAEVEVLLADLGLGGTPRR